MSNFKKFIAEHRVDLDVEHAILELYRDRRLSVAEICQRTGTSIGSVYRVLGKYGIRASRRTHQDGTGHKLI